MRVIAFFSLCPLLRVNTLQYLLLVDLSSLAQWESLMSLRFGSRPVIGSLICLSRGSTGNWKSSRLVEIYSTLRFFVFLMLIGS